MAYVISKSLPIFSFLIQAPKENGNRKLRKILNRFKKSTILLWLLRTNPRISNEKYNVQCNVNFNLFIRCVKMGT